MGFLDRFRGQPVSRVHMVISAGEFVAGEQYELPVDLADSFIAKGYAAGNFSRHFDADELAALRANSQRVSLGG